MIRVHGLKACDTCRAAVKALPGATLRDVRAEPLSDAELSRFLNAFGDALVNRRSATWRGLTDEARARDPLTLLRENPALMKRPVIDEDGRLSLGWPRPD